MTDERLDSISGYVEALEAHLGILSPAQRVAFAASIAERLFPHYQTFAARNCRGDPATFRGMLDAVWEHAQGRPIPREALDEFGERCVGLAPDRESADAADAREACHVLARALECCQEGSTSRSAAAAAVASYERVAGPVCDDPTDPEADRLVWLKLVVRLEINRQLRLLRDVRSAPRIDARAVAALKRAHGR